MAISNFYQKFVGKENKIQDEQVVHNPEDQQ